ncbi:MAG: universal stress protein [Pseudomonadota bacterium]
MLKSILMAIDLNVENSGRRRILEFGSNLGKLYGSELHVLTVFPNFGMSIVGSHFDKDFESKALAEIKVRLEDFVSQNTPAECDVKSHVAHGSVYDEIIKAAKTLDCDGIVISAHRPELKDYLLGPNAARVVRHANQSVFVLRD